MATVNLNGDEMKEKLKQDLRDQIERDQEQAKEEGEPEEDQNGGSGKKAGPEAEGESPPDPGETIAALQQILLADIKMDRDRIRKRQEANDDADEEDKALLDSLRDDGLQVPLIIDRDGVLIDGYRRYDALIKLKWKKAPYLRLAYNADAEAIKFDVNETRWQLDRFDVARFLSNQQKLTGHSHEKLARRFHKGKTTIQRLLVLDTLSTKEKDDVRKGKMSYRVATDLKSSDPKVRRAAEKALKAGKKLTTRDPTGEKKPPQPKKKYVKLGEKAIPPGFIARICDEGYEIHFYQTVKKGSRKGLKCPKGFDSKQWERFKREFILAWNNL